ncbi:MAG: hypothetical protein KJ804_09515 [Proteobacteria bacterium]|nr:hypothetical protein [Pseudomonadota bacterium]MBU1058538.1 hypothetical protein [Pseudomonadota bacterium]
MQTVLKKQFSLFSVVAFLVLLAWAPLYAGSEKEMEGWGVDDAYNKLYNPRELDKLKGKVVRFEELTPLSGMSQATALILDDDGEKIVVHLCPLWFATAKETGIKRGDQVKIKGSWAEIEGKDVFLASKVKKGENYEFKVRLTKDGTPFWTMTPEQLVLERGRD